MSRTNNQLNSSFRQIAVADANGNIVGVNLTGESVLGDVANITITGGSNAQVLTTDGAGNLSWSTPTGGDSVTEVPYISWTTTEGETTFTDANLELYTSESQLLVFRDGVLMTPDEYSLSGDTLTISTYLPANNNIEIPSRGVAVSVAGNVEYANTSGVAYSVAASNITGTVSFATLSATANSVAGANVTGAVANATFATSADSANTATTATTAGTAASATYATSAGSANTAANATFATSAASATVAATANSVAAANITGTVSFATNSTNANVANTADTANFANYAGNVTVAAQANITSLGTLSSLTVSGDTTIGGIVTVKSIAETVITPSSSATFAPDLGSGAIQKFTATSAFTFNGFTNPVAGQSGVAIITQDATGGRVMTSTMKFVGGSKTLSTAANAVDIIGVFYDGTTYYASLTKGYA